MYISLSMVHHTHATQATNTACDAVTQQFLPEVSGLRMTSRKGDIYSSGSTALQSAGCQVAMSTGPGSNQHCQKMLRLCCPPHNALKMWRGLSCSNRPGRCCCHRHAPLHLKMRRRRSRKSSRSGSSPRSSSCTDSSETHQNAHGVWVRRLICRCATRHAQTAAPSCAPLCSASAPATTCCSVAWTPAHQRSLH